MKVVVNDLQKNEYYVFSSNVGNLYFFNEGNIVLKKGINRFDISAIKDNILSTYNSSNLSVEELRLSNIKKANKIDLTRKNNFYAKHIREDWEHYGVIPQYDIYIYCGVGGDCQVNYIGEYLHNDIDGEKTYINGYGIKATFETKKAIHEYIECDNYILKDGERFGDGYGTKENPVYSTFDFNKRFINPVDKKGVIKKWFEKNVSNCCLTFQSDYITRREKDENRLLMERIAEIMSEETSQHISHYGVKRMMEKLNISIKEQ